MPYWSVGKKEAPFPPSTISGERVDLRRVNRRVIESLIKAGALDSLNAKRAQLTSALDEAMDRAQLLRKDKDNGQLNLFDMVKDQSDASPVMPDLPDIEEWSEKRKLAFEKEALGFYITGHPLDRFGQEIQLFTTTDSQRVQERA